MDSAWEQKKLEARKMLENGDESPESSVLARKVADRFAESEKVSQKMLRFAYEVGKENRPGRQTAAGFARDRLDVLGLGQELTSISWGSKKPIPLPPSGLGKKERSDVPNR